MNFKKGILVYFFIFLLVTSLANALQVSSKFGDLKLCPRDTGLFVDVLKNNEALVKSYNVVLSGAASSWATVAPGNFILAPGDEETVYTYVTPSQSASKGNYDLKLELVSGEEKKSIKHTVNVKNCFGVGLSSDSLEQSACPGDSLVYNFRLINLGEFSDTFSLNVDNDGVRLSEKTITLGKGESKDVKAFLTSPSDAKEYKFSVTGTSETSKSGKSIDFLLNVNPCYSFNLNLKNGNDYSICEHSVLTVPVTVSNEGTVSNDYNLEVVEAPVWVRLNTKDLVVGSKETRTFLLAFAPDYGVHGNHSVKVEVSPEKGDLKAVANLNVEVRQCHSVSVDIELNEDVVCKGVESKYNVNVVNNGEVAKNYNLVLDAPSWVSLSENLITNLGAGESFDLELKANPTEDTDLEKYSVNLNVVSTDESSASSQDSIVLDLKELNQCFSSVLDTDYKNVVVHYDSGLLIPLTLVNNGLKNADYTFALSGDAAEFSSLAKTKLSLDQGSNETLYLYVAPDINTNMGNYYVDVELYVNDLWLATSKVNVEITDQLEKATVIGETSIVDQATTDESWAGLKHYWRLFRYYLLGLVIFIVLVVLLFKTKAGKAVMDFFDEDLEDKPKRKKKG